MEMSATAIELKKFCEEKEPKGERVNEYTFNWKWI